MKILFIFNSKSLEEIFGTFLQRIAKEENYDKHGISLFIFSNIPHTVFQNKIKLGMTVPKHMINCTIPNCNILGIFS